MKKNCLIFIMALLLIVLSACASVDLSYSLSADNTMAIDYQLAFEDPEQDVSPVLSEIGSYWADQGMAIYADNDKKTLTGEKTLSFDSAKEAADAFADAFTSQDSIFSDVTFTYLPSFSLDTYSLSASLSLADVIRQSDNQILPADQVTALENSARQGTYTISISLPGEVTATNADSRDQNKCTWNLNYGDTRTLTLETKKENTASIQRYNELEKTIERNNALIAICGVAACLCILFIIASVIVRKIKRKRASEVRIKHFR